MSSSAATETSSNFIRDIIDDDLAADRHGGRVVTRFPPEPNGYLHIGHAKSIVLNFGIQQDYADRAATRCHLRFDDTNPETEDMEYVESIKEAVRWLGYEWDALYHASDYFEQFYQYAVKLIKQGDAYVDSLSLEEMRDYRGSVNEPGRPSPYRDRSVEENLDLFERMRAGEFEDGEHVLRAKIDMASPHMILRDPLLFRIKHASHYRQGDDWCIYPMYDYAHPLEDAIEDVTHSLCTLEFDNNRRVYDWVLEHCLEEDELPSRPHQYEFSRLNLDYTIMSKRKLLQLVEEGIVHGWDDPRLPTVFGLRRRGVTPEAIRTFCESVGITRSESRVQMTQLEHAIRDDLNTKAPRVMAVLDPVPLVIDNVDDDHHETLSISHWPREIDKHDTREVPFTKRLFVERDDVRLDPPDDFYRLAPGAEVRLRGGYFVTCTEVVTNDAGDVVEVHGTIDPDTRDSTAPDGRSPDGTIHWVSAEHAVSFEARLYDRLFDVPAPDGGEEPFTDHLHPNSLQIREAVVEPSVRDLPEGARVQFERQGYFWPDPKDSAPDALVYNQIVPLRDTWAAAEEKARQEALAEARRRKERQKEELRRRSIENKKDPVELLSDDQRTRFERYHNAWTVDREDAAILAGDDAVAAFYEETVAAYDAPQSIANWVVNELLAKIKDRPIAQLPFDASQFARLVELADDEVISSRAAREVFGTMMKDGADPDAVVDAEGLRQIDDAEALRETVRAILEDNPGETTRYRDGATNLLGFFMGQVMQATRGTANPHLAREVLKEELAA